jgi:hypothetical protein
VLRRSRRQTTRALHHQGDPTQPLLLRLLSGASHSREANCVSPSPLSTRASAAPRLCRTPPTTLRVLGHRPTVPRPSDTSPSRSVTYARRALVAAYSFAPHAASVGSLLVALRPPHPASRTIGHFQPLRSRHIALQFSNASAPLPNQLQFGTVSTAVRRRQASARPPPLLAFLPRSPSSPPSCRTTCRSSPCPSSRRPTT